jgi:predicted site-specific integrase-resolvase
MTQEPPFLTVSQATERLNQAGLTVSRDTVQRWCREEKITSQTLPSGYYRIPASEIEAIVRGERVETGAA